MITTSFIIPGSPEPQLRPRATRIGNSIRLYDPKKTRDYKSYVSMIAGQNAPENPYDRALEVKLDFYRQIPKSTSKKRKQAMNDKTERPIVKADVDNYSKAILDSLNEIIYEDDSQVVSLIANKYYSDNPRVEVTVTEILEGIT